MKKAFILIIFAVVFLFNTVGFFDVSQDDLLKNDNMSMVFASNKGDNTVLDPNSASTAGMEADDPISKSTFVILGSSLILMLLVRAKSTQ